VIFDQSTAPVAILGAAAGMAGSARAQLNLRASCVFLDMHPLNKPEVLIFQAQNKVDAGGKLTDETARGLLRELMRRPRRLVIKRCRIITTHEHA
jgi:chromate reductase, NAD(P)H dehydrogenase (quinone)